VTKVLAAIDDSAAAKPVLAVAAAIGLLFDAAPEAVHVSQDGTRTARAAADRAHVPYRELRGEPLAMLVESASADDVSAVVVGTRALPAGRGKAGHIAQQLVLALSKPVVLVPPDANLVHDVKRILVALDGTRATSEALAEMIKMFFANGVEVLILHVLEPDLLPLFTDQPQHEIRSWSTEFLARHCPRPGHARLEVRVGMPEHHLLQVAEAENADLLVLGWAQSFDEGHAAVVREALERGRYPTLLIPVPSTGQHPPDHQQAHTDSLRYSRPGDQRSPRWS
jgi:nucleotide-binding universal stress UspA family protein